MKKINQNKYCYPDSHSTSSFIHSYCNWWWGMLCDYKEGNSVDYQSTFLFVNDRGKSGRLYITTKTKNSQALTDCVRWPMPQSKSKHWSIKLATKDKTTIITYYRLCPSRLLFNSKIMKSNSSIYFATDWKFPFFKEIYCLSHDLSTFVKVFEWSRMGREAQAQPMYVLVIWAVFWGGRGGTLASSNAVLNSFNIWHVRKGVVDLWLSTSLWRQPSPGCSRDPAQPFVRSH